MSCTILCDFDGTISNVDVTDLLLEALADVRWRAVEDEWREGRIGSAECMARQVAFITASRAELDRQLDEIEIDPDFPAFVRWCALQGLPLTVVSDGIDYAIDRILRRHGLAGLPIVANHLLFMGERRYGLQSPHADPRCRSSAGTCKCAVAARTAGPSLSILIGDGRSDFCAAGDVDLVIAKSSLLDHCVRQDLPHMAFADFSEMPALVGRVLDEVIGAPAVRSVA